MGYFPGRRIAFAAGFGFGAAIAGAPNDLLGRVAAADRRVGEVGVATARWVAVVQHTHRRVGKHPSRGRLK